MNYIIDVSTFQGLIAWTRVRAAGVTRAIIRGPIGDHWVDDAFQTNWSGAAAAGIPKREIYGDVLRTGTAHGQALNWLTQTGGDFGTGPIHLDVERTDAERNAIAAGTLVWDQVGYTAMLHDLVIALQGMGATVSIYTSRNEWLAMTTDPEWARALLLWVAHYNQHIAQPDVPDGWDWALWQKGQMPVDGIANPVDYSVEKVSAVTTPQFQTPRGSYIGVHSINPGNTLAQALQSKADGTDIPGYIILNDPAACAQIADASGKPVYCRFDNISGDDESLNNVTSWNDGQRSGWATRQLAHITANATDAQIGKIAGFISHNEADPPGVAGWQAMGLAYGALADLAAQTNLQRVAAGKPVIHLAYGATAQGTPEWDEAEALVATGLFDKIHAAGDTWLAHEGVVARQDIDTWYGDSLPGGPAIPFAGALNFRWVYLFSLLLARGVPVKIAITEFYAGGGYPGDPNDNVARFGWVDAHLAALPAEYARWFVFFAGFTCNPDAHWMNISDYDKFYTSPELRAYRQKVKDRINGTGETEMQPIGHYKALQDLTIRDAAGNPALDPVGAPPVPPATGGVVKAGTTIHVFALGVTAGVYPNRAVISADGQRNVWGVAAALVKV